MINKQIIIDMSMNSISMNGKWKPVALALVGIGVACGLSTNTITAGQTTAAEGQATAIFAGGCFWCVEAGFEKVPGVIDAVSGYTGGMAENPTYRQVASGQTKHTEAVKVIYDPEQITYDELLDAFWKQFDPTDNEGSFVDRGQQYRPGIFYASEEERELAQASRDKLDASGRFEKPIVTEITAATAFYDAEDYHQDYYKKNALRYKYYRKGSGRDQFLTRVWGDELNATPTKKVSKAKEAAATIKKDPEMSKKYTKPSDEELKAKLSPMEYKVTQHEGTEPPFSSDYHDSKEEGIYVDIVSGEPLFSSVHKYDSGTGWPSFDRPIDEQFVATKKDFKLILPRTEVRSVYGDSHLGHVFKDGPSATTGLRYCINAASLRFVPKDELVAQGYGEYAGQFSE